ncbi:hypothetical protein HCJ66_01450 [Listeria sp. FSL L7-1582]|uniref:hypothetical protein n=1 Tax=Listeria portnoyi TaxID=2713504 RepID=UPI00164E9A7F|nr:hypothetical protein [Listeria portnoyi]MBC6308209.1 hypothetical protein [Listeria portnoyi]
MQLNTEILKAVSEIEYLSHSNNLGNEYELINDLKSANKSINSLKWENLCLEERGTFTAFLSNNNRDLFRNWNHLTAEVKEKIIPITEEKLDKLISEGYLLEDMKSQIKFDIVNITLYKSYSSVVRSDFYELMYSIYLSGYIPCGWAGKYPKGKIKVM